MHTREMRVLWGSSGEQECSRSSLQVLTVSAETEVPKGLPLCCSLLCFLARVRRNGAPSCLCSHQQCWGSGRCLCLQAAPTPSTAPFVVARLGAAKCRQQRTLVGKTPSITSLCHLFTDSISSAPSAGKEASA